MSYTRDLKALRTCQVSFADVAKEIWLREGVLVTFLYPPHRFIRQTPRASNDEVQGYRYERALPGCYPLSSLIKRIEREVGDVGFIIVLPDGRVISPGHPAHSEKTMGYVRHLYSNFF